MKGIEVIDKHQSFLSINKPCQSPELATVRYDDILGRNRCSGHSLAVLDHVNETDVTAIRRIVGPITGRESACIGERAKVEKWTSGVIDEPQPVLTAKSYRPGSQSLVHLLVIGQIFDRDIGGSRGEQGDGDSDAVASRYSDVG